MDDEANKAYDKRFFRFRVPFKPFKPFKVVSAFLLRIVGVNLQGVGGAEGKMFRTPPLAFTNAGRMTATSQEKSCED